jgi:branched-chain amino acid aminotransferase
MAEPFDNRPGYIWLDGAFVPWSEAKVHVLTHALHYASCVFEGQRAYAGQVFKLEEHTQRLFNSAAILGMEPEVTEDQINEACKALIVKQGLEDCYMRPMMWRGSEQMGVSAQQTKTHAAIAVWQWPSYFDPAQKLKGLRLCIAKWRRPAPYSAPTQAKAAGLYMICTLSKHEAEGKGYADALMLDWRGQVAEATGANVFFVKDNALHTPTPDCFLDGITRRSVMDLARKRNIPIIERVIWPEEMEDFEQCFITGTAAEVTPIGEIGPYRFEVGDITRALMTDYEAEVRAHAA